MRKIRILRTLAAAFSVAFASLAAQAQQSPAIKLLVGFPAGGAPDAIARAFANDPMMLFADEPTGNLDRATAGRVVDLLFEMNRERGTTLLLVTHDRELAARCGRTIELKAGRMVGASDERPV